MKICMPCMIETSCLMYAHLLALENQRESKTSTDRYLRRKLTYLAQLRSKKRNFLSMQCFTLQFYRLVAQNLVNRALYNVVAFTSLSLFVILCHLYCLSPVFKPASSWCCISHSHYSICIAALLYLHHCIIIICTFQIFVIVNLNINHNHFKIRVYSLDQYSVKWK